MMRTIIHSEVIIFLVTITYTPLLSEEFNAKGYIHQSLNVASPDVSKFKDPTIWHAYEFHTGTENRENLIIENLRADDVLDIDEEVMEWKSLNSRTGSIIVGRIPSGFIVMAAVLNINGTFLFTSNTLVLDKFPTAFDVYKIWSTAKLEYDMYLVFATASDDYHLQWFRITKDMALEEIWRWNLKQKATHVRVFEVNQYPKLLIIYEGYVPSGRTTAEIYDLDLEDDNYKFRLFQTLNLNCTSRTSAINYFAEEVYISIPQQFSNHVQVYKLSRNEFIEYSRIFSRNVAVVTDFTIGFRSFLAVGGFDSAIYQNTKKGLIEIRVDIDFDEVTYYLPLRAKTYRDEVLLLVQHHVDHSAPQVEVLLYSRGNFYVHNEIPCSHIGREYTGATCMIDPDGDSGIIGSAVLNIDKTLAILVPYQVRSRLFYVNRRLREVNNPVARRVSKIIESKFKYQELFNQQKKDTQHIRHRLKQALSVNTDNEIIGNWRVNTIVVPETHHTNTHYENLNEYSQKMEPFPFEWNFLTITDYIDLLEKKIQTRSVNSKQDLVFDNFQIYGTLRADGETRVENLFLENINGIQLDPLIEDCVRSSKDNLINGSKTFKQAAMKNLNFGELNNIPADNIAYHTKQGLKLQGNLTFTRKVQILEDIGIYEGGKLNDIDVKNDLVHMNSRKSFESMNIQNLDVKSMNNVEIMNDINLEDVVSYKDINQEGLDIEMDYLDLSQVEIKSKHINDQEYTSFISSLCLRSTDCKLRQNTTIRGKMHIRQSADVRILNGLEYRNAYVINERKNGFIKITGKKIFRCNVSTTEAIVEGLVDNVDPDEILTSYTAQTIPENFTFADLEITESFQVDGDIYIGPNLTKFIPNPTLEDTEILDSDVYFTNLEVEGSIFVSSLFNGTSLQAILDSVVYQDEENVLINTRKKFTEKLFIQNNLNVESNTINNMELDDIITTSSEQIITNTNANGRIAIENLELTENFNGEDLMKQIQEFIHLDADEIIESEIIFDNKDDAPDMIASKLKINRVNNLRAADFILTIGQREFQNGEFEALNVNSVEFINDVCHKIECFDIDDYKNNRFSLSTDQTIAGNIRIANGSMENIITEIIDDVEWSFIENYLNISEIFFEKFITGQFSIGELHVEDSITLHNLNDESFNTLLETVFWTNMSNKFRGTVKFGNDVAANGLIIEKLNGTVFNQYPNNFVLRSAKNISLDGNKYFQNGFTIIKNLETQRINGIPIGKILSKSKDQIIPGHVNIHGDLHIKDNLNVDNYLNGVTTKYLRDTLEVDGEKCLIKGDISFQEFVILDHLRMNGEKGKLDLADYIDNIVGITDDIVINGTITFENKVRILENLEVATLIEGVNLNDVIQNVVLITSDDYIQGLVAFRQSVEILDTIILETNLDTRYLCGCDTQEWQKRAVHIVNNHLPGAVKFKKISALRDLNPSNINGVNMSDLLLLHSDQMIEATLDMGFVKSEDDILVGAHVNSYNIENEYQNTVMTNRDQELNTHLIFLNPISITHHLKTHGLVNGRDLNRLVTIDTDQNMTASYSFHDKVTINSNLSVLGRINDIHMDDWRRRTITTFGEKEQDIEDKWNVPGKVIFKKTAIGDGLLGGLNIVPLVKKMIQKQKEKYDIGYTIRTDYTSNCKSVKNLVEIGKQRPFIFRHLEYHEELHLKNEISALHYFQDNHQHFLIVGQKQSCNSYLFEWILDSFKFTVELDTGEVEQFITITDYDRTYLITKNVKSTSCKDSGTNVWIFNKDTLTHIHEFNNSVILQKSEIPRTFYSFGNGTVIEHKLSYRDNKTTVQAHRQWNITSAMSQQSNLGMDLLGETRMKRYYDKGEAIYAGNQSYQTVVPTFYLPPEKIKEYVIFNMRDDDTVENFIAFAVWEESTIENYSDEIKIYEDLGRGKLFGKILTRRPSNLNVIRFETSNDILLIFLEDYKVLKLYELSESKGLHLRSNILINAKEIITASLPVQSFQSRREFLLLVDKNIVTLFQAAMYGDRPLGNIYCEL